VTSVPSRFEQQKFASLVSPKQRSRSIVGSGSLSGSSGSVSVLDGGPFVPAGRWPSTRRHPVGGDAQAEMIEEDSW